MEKRVLEAGDVGERRTEMYTLCRSCFEERRSEYISITGEVVAGRAGKCSLCGDITDKLHRVICSQATLKDVARIMRNENVEIDDIDVWLEEFRSYIIFEYHEGEITK